MKKPSSIFHKNNAAKASRLGREHFWHKIGNDPLVDWVIIFSVSILVSIVLVAVGAYVYVDGATELSSLSPVTIANNPSHFDAQELDRIISAFDGRTSERVLLNKAYSGPSDPSLP